MTPISPRRRPGSYVFVTESAAIDATVDIVMRFREDEGTTLIIPTADADRLGLPHAAPLVWITLEVYSQLEDVGLTAAFSAALAKVKISCNVVAALQHDHLFVPERDADDAVRVLQEIVWSPR